jgi:hypothetical protein
MAGEARALGSAVVWRDEEDEESFQSKKRGEEGRHTHTHGLVLESCGRGVFFGLLVVGPLRQNRPIGQSSGRSNAISKRSRLAAHTRGFDSTVSRRCSDHPVGRASIRPPQCTSTHPSFSSPAPHMVGSRPDRHAGGRRLGATSSCSRTASWHRSQPQEGRQQLRVHGVGSAVQRRRQAQGALGGRPAPDASSGGATGRRASRHTGGGQSRSGQMVGEVGGLCESQRRRCRCKDCRLDSL